MAEIEISKVSIKIGGQEIELTVAQAKELQQILNEAFGKSDVQIVPTGPIIVERRTWPMQPTRPTYPSPWASPYIYWTVAHSDNMLTCAVNTI